MYKILYVKYINIYIYIYINICKNKLHLGWDMEYNKVIRHYHGHLSGVFCLNLHPTLDILITGGRDSVARVSNFSSID